MCCTKCGTQIPEGNRYCGHCGAEVPKVLTACPHCGIEVSPGTKFCGQCGHKLVGESNNEERNVWTVLSIACIWVAILFVSIFASDMVTGSEQHQMPIAAMVGPIWGIMGTGFVLLLARGPSMEKKYVWMLLSIASIWLSVLFASVLSPDLVTGSDPTHIPIGAVTCPFWGAIATGFVAALGRGPSIEKEQVWMASSIIAIWVAAAITSAVGPEVIYGSDPSRLPIVTIVSPIVGTIATGIVCAYGWFLSSEG